MLYGHDSYKNSSYCDPNVMQGDGPTCAVRSQELIMRDFGIDIPEDTLLEIAKAKGLYDNGTTMANNGKLLEAVGIPVHSSSNNNLDDLKRELEAGHRIIVNVDPAELQADFGSDEWMSAESVQHASHALIVAGFKEDLADPANDKVILIDPGTGHVYEEFKAEHFDRAWADSGRYMMATDNAALFEYDPESQSLVAVGDIADPAAYPEFMAVDVDDAQDIADPIDDLDIPDDTLFDNF